MDNIQNYFNSEITSKITLSISIRIKLEKYIVDYLGIEKTWHDKENNNNQTSVFLRKIKEVNKEKFKKILQFDIATSNIIHLNSLNYEVLYYNINYLKKLYKDINLIINEDK